MGFSLKKIGRGIIKALPVVGPVLDAFGQASANKTNKRLAREQMAFQERMRDTEWQAGVKDMLAAGINPMLAVSQGGAASPQGASTNVEPIFKNTGHSAMAVKLQQAQLDQIKEVTEGVGEDNYGKRLTNDMLAHNLPWSSANAYERAMQLRHQTETFAQQAKKAASEAELTAQQLREKNLTNNQLELMQPLVREYQRIINEAERLGLDVKEVEAKFAREMGDQGKLLRFIKDLIK